MKTIPKKHDYPWGYEITWAETPRSQSKILHINTEQIYKWGYQDTVVEHIHCLFGSLFIVTYDGEDKIWPGESYALDSNVKAIKAGHEAAEVLLVTILEKNVEQLPK